MIMMIGKMNMYMHKEKVYGHNDSGRVPPVL